MPNIEEPTAMTTVYRGQLPAELGHELRRVRMAHGWLLADVAERVDISIPYLSLLERGLRCPSTAVAERLIDVLGLDGDTEEDLLAASVDGKGYSRQEPGDG